MHAKLFYQTDAENTVPLTAISKEQWDAGLTAISANEYNAFQTQQFNGKCGDICVLNDAENHISRAFIGTGDNHQDRAMAQAALRLPPNNYQLQNDWSQSALVNWGLAQYRFIRYKKHEIQPRVLKLNPELHNDVVIDVDAMFLVRDLINTPANDMGPKDLARIMAEIAEQHKAEFGQWIGDELLTANFPAIHAVGRASADEPRLLSLSWGHKHRPRVTLVGKGVCFDSGGLDLKPASFMRLMKKDMGGAAHVLGLAQWIMSHHLPIHLEVLIPAVENSVSANAFRPGDILTMRNGLTVEIDNTDAEGRLILADALLKAAETEPELIIDFATLTGAARTALGTDISALFTNDDSLAAAMLRIGQEIHDPIWQLPLYAGYENLLDSPIADLANCHPSPYAGAIVAALFLKRFVPAATAWMHFDVMAWNIGNHPGKPEGGEAMALRAAGHFLMERYKDAE